MFIQQLCNMHKALYELSLMAHKAEKGFQIQITGLHTFFGDSVCQVVDLFFEKTTLWWL